MWRLLRKTNPSSRWREGPHFQNVRGLQTNNNLVIGPDGARNQELCWRGPAAIYCYAMIFIIVITQILITIATNCRALTCRMNASYVTNMQAAFFSVYRVYSVSFDNM
jgi:hypothetical protein